MAPDLIENIRLFEKSHMSIMFRVSSVLLLFRAQRVHYSQPLKQQLLAAVAADRLCCYNRNT